MAKKRKNSRAKGAAGERELAEMLRAGGFTARRGQQFSGSPDSPDVHVDIPWLHIECKRTETLSLYVAMDQAKADCGEKKPCVMHRRSRKPWLAIMELPDFLSIVRKAMLYDQLGETAGLGDGDRYDEQI